MDTKFVSSKIDIAFNTKVSMQYVTAELDRQLDLSVANRDHDPGPRTTLKSSDETVADLVTTVVQPRQIRRPRSSNLFSLPRRRRRHRRRAPITPLTAVGEWRPLLIFSPLIFFALGVGR